MNIEASEMFAKAAADTYEHEGGDYHGTDPDDRNPTRKGVIQATYTGWRLKQGLPDRSVFEATDEEIDRIYHAFWTEAHCDDMPYFVALACFDMAINSGPKRALALFQQAMGFEGDPLRYTGETDGKWGPKTMGAARTATRNEWAAACRYQMVRVMYYHRIADQPSEFNELKSWLSRVNKFNKKYLLNCSIS